MPNPNDLIALADLKLWVGVSSANDDTLLSALITGASYWFLRACNRQQLLTATYNERYNGHGGRVLLLRQGPVQSVSSLTAAGVVIPASPDGLQPGYVNDDQSVMLVGGCDNRFGYRFYNGYLNISVTYSAGYTAVPMDVQQAAKAICGAWYRRRGWMDQASKSLAPGEVVSFRKEDIPPEAERTIQQYTRRAPIQ